MPPDEPKTPEQQKAEEEAAKAAGQARFEDRPLYQGEGKPGAQTTEAPTLDHAGVTQRLVMWLRAHGFLTHRELVEILGLEDVEIEHRHPDTEQWETKEVTDANGVTRQVKIGKASVAEDSVAARHYVQEVLDPGSTKPPAKERAA